MTALPAAAIGRRVQGGKPGLLRGGRVRQGTNVEFLEVRLTQFNYPSGGYALDRGVTGMAVVFDAEVLAGKDPYGDPVPTPGVQVVVDLDKENPDSGAILRVYTEGGVEAEPGWVGEDLGNVWLGVHGTR